MLAALLGILFIGVLLLAVLQPEGENVEVRTQVMHEMVATMDGWMQCIGFEANASAEARTQNWLPWAAWLGTLLCAAVVLVRARNTQHQHESRSKRS